MKKLTLAMVVALIVGACNNTGDGDKNKDTVIIDVSNQGNTDAGDTASYERMSNKITDSTQQ